MNDKIKKTLIIGATTAMLGGNVNAVKFKVKNAPKVESTRIEQTLPDSAQEFQSKYDATEALQLVADIVKNPLFEDNTDAGMEEIKNEILGYLKRAKANRSDLVTAYQEFFAGKTNQEIPAAISKTLDNEITTEEIKSSSKAISIYCGKYSLPLKCKYKHEVEDIMRELADSVKDKSANMHVNDPENPYENLIGLKHNMHVFYHPECVTVDSIKQCAKYLPHKYGDINLCIGLLAENANTAALSRLFRHCYLLGIDVRPWIEEANKANEKPQKPIELEKGM